MFSFRTILRPHARVRHAALTVAPLASAKGGNGVRVSGTCTQSSTAKLKLGREDGRIEVEFEVDQNRNGVPGRSRCAGTDRSSPRRPQPPARPAAPSPSAA